MDGTDLLVPGPNIRDFENMRLPTSLRDYKNTRFRDQKNNQCHGTG